MSRTSNDAAADLPERGRTLEFQVHGNLRLVGDAWGDPEAPPALLFHGGGQTRHSWAGTARELANDGWYAVAIDMRGHGESDWADDADYHHSTFAQDVIAIAKQCKSLPILVGASLGGIASLLATKIAEEPVARGLILVDIATRMEADGAARIVQFMTSKPEGFASLDEAADAIAAYNPHRPRPTNLEGLRKNLRETPEGRFTWHWDPRFLTRVEKAQGDIPGKYHDPDLLNQAARSLSIPTLLVRGKMSDLLSEEGAKLFLEQVPHAKYADVSGAGHMVAGDRNDLFTRSVREFLQSEFS